MISPEAQLKKEKHNFWGDPNVLTFSRLDQTWKKKFIKLSNGPAMIKKTDLERRIRATNYKNFKPHVIFNKRKFNLVN